MFLLHRLEPPKLILSQLCRPSTLRSVQGGAMHFAPRLFPVKSQTALSPVKLAGLADTEA